MHSPQLRRTEATSSPHATTPRKQLIDKLVRHRIGDQFQEIHCSNRRKVLTHDQRTTPSGDTCRYQTKKQQFIGVSPLFPRTSNSFRNTLRRDGRNRRLHRTHTKAELSNSSKRSAESNEH